MQMVDGTKTDLSSHCLLQHICRFISHSQVVIFMTRKHLNIMFRMSHGLHQANSARRPESDTPVRDFLCLARMPANHSRKEWMSIGCTLTHLTSDRPWVEVWLAHVWFFLLALFFVLCHHSVWFFLLIPSSP